MGTPAAAPAALRVSGLTAGYGGAPVLRGVELQLPLGEWLVLLGPNGSGKSTLLYCVAGLLRPESGRIELCGVSLAEDAPAAKQWLGFACAPDRLPDLLTGRQCLEVYAAAKGLHRIDSGVLALADAFSFTTVLDQFVDAYSLGMRQKLAVLLALLGGPRLIVLDEAFNGLDPASGRVLKRHLRQLVATGNASVVLATHALDIVEHYADRAALLLGGRIVRTWNAADIAAMRNHPQGFEETLSAAAAECGLPP